jgi:hypothetical protein
MQLRSKQTSLVSCVGKHPRRRAPTGVAQNVVLTLSRRVPYSWKLLEAIASFGKVSLDIRNFTRLTGMHV